MAIVLGFDAATSPMNDLLQFEIPWANVAEVVGVAHLLVVLAILAPSVRAAQLPPASTIRYSERAGGGALRRPPTQPRQRARSHTAPSTRTTIAASSAYCR
jgi:hypothetical protein